MGLRSTATTRLVAAVDQGGDGGEPDRPAPEHGHTVAGFDLGLVGGVHPDRERLGERGHVERQVVGDAVEAPSVGLGDQQERGEPAFGGAVADPTELVVPGCTTTRSPTRALVTSGPTQSTTPAISWPRHIGVPAGPATPPIVM